MTSYTFRRVNVGYPKYEIVFGALVSFCQFPNIYSWIYEIGLFNYFKEWSNVSSLLKESRLAAVSRLQKLYEMMEFTDLISKDGKVFISLF